MKKLIKLKTKISYGRQYIDKADSLAVLRSLNSATLSNGPYVNIFEKKIKKYFGCKFPVVCSSGTAALHLAFLSLDLKKNDVVILPVINFIAAANILTLMRVNFFFADVDKESGQISRETLLKCLHENKIKKIKAVVTTYLGGSIFNYQEILDLKKKYKFFLVEDACHAFGSKYNINGSYYKVGSCKHADISTFSFPSVRYIY